MAFDEGVAQRVREALSERPDVVEKNMFGGMTFMLRGNMCVGVVGEELMLRVGKERNDELLGRPHARQMDFSGKPMAGYLFVAPAGFDSDTDLEAWIDAALEFVLTLPPK